MQRLMDKLKQKCLEKGQHVYADKISHDHIKLIAIPKNNMISALTFDIRTETDLDHALNMLTKDPNYGFTKQEILNAILQTDI